MTEPPKRFCVHCLEPVAAVYDHFSVVRGWTCQWAKEGPGLVRFPKDSRPVQIPPPYVREALVDVVIHHGRSDIKGCHCGWSELGKSHAEHVADVYERNVLMGRQA